MPVKNHPQIDVSLLVRLWVEILSVLLYVYKVNVSLLVRLWVEMSITDCNDALDYGQPPCEAVSWNITAAILSPTALGQPPCEAVSWNEQLKDSIQKVTSSASLWGCELKYIVTKKRDLWHWSASLWGCELKYRSLQQQRTWKESASLWGCELKCGSYAIGLCGLPVSLLVRLWVEIHLRRHNLLWFCCQPPCEAVSWNRCVHYGEECVLCQPPCEAVSWNTTVIQASEVCMSQPPCEAVSWNTILVWMER